ncbi:hypothetical protein V2A60_009707 [Cordyceps javanica]
MRSMSLLHIVQGACLAVLVVTAHAAPAVAGAGRPLARLTISLAPGDETLLPRAVRELSDPAHSRYGKHVSREEAFALLAPSAEALTAVKSWLRDAAGLHDDDLEQHGQLLHATVSAGQSASLVRRRGDDDGDGRHRLSGMYAAVADAAVRKHIRAIHLDGPARDGEPGQRYASRSLLLSPPLLAQSGKVEEKESRGGPDDDCVEKLTPACLREKYQMKNIPPTSKKTKLGIIGFNMQTAQYADLDLFFRDIDPLRAGANFSEVFLNGGENRQGEYPGGEGNLDIQYAVALAAPNVDVQFISVGGMNSDFIPDLDLPADGFTEPYLDFVTALAALPAADLPSVISISYGVNEQLLRREYAQHVCDVFGQLAARGVSVLAASGDSGPGQSCQANDGSGAARFLPMFPASCPYVTAVGGTRGTGGGGGIAEETAMELSAGGFSEYFARPAYQTGVVDAYLARHGEEWRGLYNPAGRGIPDVAALASNYQIYNHLKVESADGTSASTPVLAAMIAVLNSLRAEKGKPPMGFLNPWLYTTGRRGFTDITTGKSSGCPGTSYASLPSPYIPGAGWPADEGWDAATGLGTPVFSRLRRLAAGAC